MQVIKENIMEEDKLSLWTKIKLVVKAGITLIKIFLRGGVR